MSTSFTDLSVWETQYIDTFFIAATVLRGKFGRDGWTWARRQSQRAHRWTDRRTL